LTFQQRIKACMRRQGLRVADVARHFNVAYTTAREWVLFGRQPQGTDRDRMMRERRLQALERQ
jgi:transposase-like protein